MTLLDELPIFEQVKRDILTNDLNDDKFQSGNITSARDNINRRKKKKVGFSVKGIINYLMQPPLSAYSAFETRPFLIKPGSYTSNNRRNRIRKTYDESSILIERRKHHIDSIRKLGMNLFEPIGFQYRKTHLSKRIASNKDDSNDVHNLARENNHNSSFQFLENNGLMISMNTENVDNSLVIPRRALFNDRSFNRENGTETSINDSSNTTSTGNSSMSDDNIDENEEHYNRSSQRHIISGSDIRSGSVGFDGPLPHSYDEVSIPRYQNSEIVERNSNANNEDISDNSMDEYLDEIEDEDW